MNDINALILAAGRGTRMPSPRPKVLQTLLGESMLTLVTATLAAMPRVGRVLTLVGNEADMVSAEAGRAAERLGIAACCIRQERQLGTGHALMTAMPHLEGDGCVLVVNGDAPLLTADVLNHFLAAAEGADVAFLSLELDDAAAYGRVIRKNGAVRAIVEAKDFDPALYGPLEDAREVNTGIYLFSLPAVRRLLPHLSCDNRGGEYYITDLVALGLAAGMDVRGIRAEGAGCEKTALLGVNTPAELAAAEDILTRRRCDELLASGVVLLLFNLVLLRLSGNTGVAAYGVVANLALVGIAVFTGLCTGIQPLVSRSSGLGDREQLRRLFRWGICTALGIAAVLCVSVFLGAEPLTAVFNSEHDPQLAAYAESGLRIYFTGFLFAGVNMVTAAFFSASDKTVQGFAISLLRGVIAVPPILFPLAWALGVDGVWLTFPMVELVTAVAALVWARKYIIEN